MQNLDGSKAARINGRAHSTRMRLAPVLARPLKNVKSIALNSNLKDIAALAPVRYCKLEDFKVSPLCGFFASICSPRAVHRVQPLEDVEVTALGGIPARVPAESGVTVHVHPPQLVQISPSRQSVGESVQPSSPPAFLQSLAVSVHAVELLLGQVLAVVALSLRDLVALHDRERRGRDARPRAEAPRREKCGFPRPSLFLSQFKQLAFLFAHFPVVTSVPLSRAHSSAARAPWRACRGTTTPTTGASSRPR